MRNSPSKGADGYGFQGSFRKPKSRLFIMLLGVGHVWAHRCQYGKLKSIFGMPDNVFSLLGILTYGCTPFSLLCAAYCVGCTNPCWGATVITALYVPHVTVRHYSITTITLLQNSLVLSRKHSAVSSQAPIAISMPCRCKYNKLSLKWVSIHKSACELYKITQWKHTHLDTHHECPTSNLFLNEVYYVKVLLDWRYQERRDDENFIFGMLENVKIKLDKYWGECNLLMAFRSNMQNKGYWIFLS